MTLFNRPTASPCSFTMDACGAARTPCVWWCSSGHVQKGPSSSDDHSKRSGSRGARLEGLSSSPSSPDCLPWSFAKACSVAFAVAASKASVTLRRPARAWRNKSHRKSTSKLWSAPPCMSAWGSSDSPECSDAKPKARASARTRRHHSKRCRTSARTASFAKPSVRMVAAFALAGVRVLTPVPWDGGIGGSGMSPSGAPSSACSPSSPTGRCQDLCRASMVSIPSKPDEGGGGGGIAPPSLSELGSKAVRDLTPASLKRSSSVENSLVPSTPLPAVARPVPPGAPSCSPGCKVNSSRTRSCIWRRSSAKQVLRCGSSTRRCPPQLHGVDEVLGCNTGAAASLSESLSSSSLLSSLSSVEPLALDASDKVEASDSCRSAAGSLSVLPMLELRCLDGVLSVGIPVVSAGASWSAARSEVEGASPEAAAPPVLLDASLGASSSDMAACCVTKYVRKERTSFHASSRQSDTTAAAAASSASFSARTQAATLATALAPESFTMLSHTRSSTWGNFACLASLRFWATDFGRRCLQSHANSTSAEPVSDSLCTVSEYKVDKQPSTSPGMTRGSDT